MSPLAEMTPQNVPSEGVQLYRTPSQPGLASSVTSNRSLSQPASAEEVRIGIQVVLKDPQIREGDVTEAIVSITNKSDQVIPTPVAIVGIPGGLEVRHDQLKELVKSGRIDAYEVIGREVVLQVGEQLRLALRKRMAAAGREHVRENFLITRDLRDQLELVAMLARVSSAGSPRC